MEPVQARIVLRRPGTCTVMALDHECRKGPQALSVPVRQQQGVQVFSIGKAFKTVYDLVEFS